jgi:hypothetical protein
MALHSVTKSHLRMNGVEFRIKYFREAARLASSLTRFGRLKSIAAHGGLAEFSYSTAKSKPGRDSDG